MNRTTLVILRKEHKQLWEYYQLAKEEEEKRNEEASPARLRLLNDIKIQLEDLLDTIARIEQKMDKLRLQYL